MNQFHTTQGVPEPERLSYWIELARKTYVDLEIKQQNQEPLFGSISVEPLGCTELSVVDSCEQLVLRKPPLRLAMEKDFYMVVLQVRSSGILKQDGREVKLPPGHWTLLDTARPYEIFGCGHFRHLVMSIPRSILGPQHKGINNLTAIDLLQALPLGEVVAKHLNRLFNSLNDVHADERLVLGESIMHLISGALMNALGNSRGNALSDNNRVELVTSYIDRHLRDPDLSVNSIAESLNVSKRYVHKIFENQGVSVSEHIRNLRLENCRRDLVGSVGRQRAITEIAFNWGFNNPAHFSTLFKKHFGKAPRDIRELG